MQNRGAACGEQRCIVHAPSQHPMALKLASIPGGPSRPQQIWPKSTEDSCQGRMLVLVTVLADGEPLPPSCQMVRFIDRMIENRVCRYDPCAGYEHQQ